MRSTLASWQDDVQNNSLRKHSAVALHAWICATQRAENTKWFALSESYCEERDDSLPSDAWIASSCFMDIFGNWLTPDSTETKPRTH